MAKANPGGEGSTTVAKNRKAGRDYFIDERIEAGIALMGSEVKSLRAGRASINEAYASELDGDFWLLNCHIPEYAPSGRAGHEPTRRRKLLLHRRQINKLIGTVQTAGVTVIPLAIYFNARGIAKVQLGVGRGKRKYDKRASEKAKDWRRDKERLLRDKN